MNVPVLGVLPSPWPSPVPAIRFVVPDVQRDENQGWTVVQAHQRPSGPGDPDGIELIARFRLDEPVQLFEMEPGMGRELWVLDLLEEGQRLDDSDADRPLGGPDRRVEAGADLNPHRSTDWPTLLRDQVTLLDRASGNNYLCTRTLRSH